jgi:hypothetical protein
MTERAVEAMCDAYVRQHDRDAASKWRVRTEPPSQMEKSGLPKFPDIFLESQERERHVFVWYEHEDGRLGVCAVSVSAECATGFFIYPAEGLAAEPPEYRVSHSCGPL